MAIKLTRVAQVEHPVDVFVPNERGTHDKGTIRPTFRLLTRSEMRDTIEAFEAGSMTTDDALRRDVLNIKGVNGDDGKALEFDADLLEALLDQTEVFRALEGGWYEVQSQRTEHAKKN